MGSSLSKRNWGGYVPKISLRRARWILTLCYFMIVSVLTNIGNRRLSSSHWQRFILLIKIRVATNQPSKHQRAFTENSGWRGAGEDEGNFPKANSGLRIEAVSHHVQYFQEIPTALLNLHGRHHAWRRSSSVRHVFSRRASWHTT